MELLPDETLELVFTFLSPYTSLVDCRLVCRRWRALVSRMCRRLRRQLHLCCRQLRLEWFHYEPVTASTVIGDSYWRSGVAGRRRTISSSAAVVSREEADANSCAVGRSLSGQLKRPLMGAHSHTLVTPPLMPRCGHAAAMVDRLMYVFGGCSYRGTTFNDLWCLEPATLSWSRPPAVGTYPSPKAFCGAAVWRRRRPVGGATGGAHLVVFGGWTMAPPAAWSCHQLHSELHTYDVAACRWRRLTPSDSGAADPLWPPGTYFHACSVIGDLLVVTGGLQQPVSGGAIRVSNSVWAYHLTDHCWTNPPCCVPRDNTAAAAATDTAVKSDSESSSEPSPFPARFGHSQLTLDHRHILVVGGTAGANAMYGDAWLLEVFGARGGPAHGASDEPVWRWRQLHVQSTGVNVGAGGGCVGAPAGGGGGVPSTWGHQACRVNDSVLVLSHRTATVPVRCGARDTAADDHVSFDTQETAADDGAAFDEAYMDDDHEDGDDGEEKVFDEDVAVQQQLLQAADIHQPVSDSSGGGSGSRLGEGSGNGSEGSAENGAGTGRGSGCLSGRVLSIRRDALLCQRQRHAALDRLASRLAHLSAPRRRQRRRSPVSAHYRLVATPEGTPLHHGPLCPTSSYSSSSSGGGVGAPSVATTRQAARVRLYVLDISRAAATGRVTWRSGQCAELTTCGGAGEAGARAPERVRYSMVAGRGELLVFGGVAIAQCSGGWATNAAPLSAPDANSECAVDTTSNMISVLSLPADLIA